MATNGACCGVCGQNLDVVGSVHNCIPKEDLKTYPLGILSYRTAPCPVCEGRRLKQIEAQKRYREKKGPASRR